MIKSFKSFSINESALDKDWGWFDPDYKLYSFSNLKRLVNAGKIQNPNILRLIKEHYDFIGYITNGKITSSPAAIKQGWVRWMITEGENLYIHFEKNVTDRKKFLESFMAKMKTPYKGVVIEVQDGYNLLTDYGMDLTPAQFIEYFDTEKLWSFRDRKERRLDEKQLHDEYTEWGLVAPSGKFYSSFDPIFEKYMDKNNKLNFYHARMWEFITTGKISEFDDADTKRKRAKNFEKALEGGGWIRWAVEDVQWRNAIYLNIDTNLKNVPMSNFLKLLKNVTAYYEKIHLDSDDGAYSFVSRTQFLSFLKSELLEETILKEEPHEIMWYRDWGYVAPDGEVVSGLLRPVIDTHEELLRDIVGEKKYASVYLNPYTALQHGFVRWFTFKNSNTGNYILTCLCMMGKDIDKKILKLYRHVKKDVNFIEIDLMLKDKKTHKFFSGSNLESVMAEFSEFVNKGKQQIQEKSAHVEYREWGLVDPNGKIFSSLDPQFENLMDENNPQKFYHAIMYDTVSKRRDKMRDAIEERGWIRWSIDFNDTLFIDCKFEVVPNKKVLIIFPKKLSTKFKSVVYDDTNDFFDNYGEYKEFILNGAVSDDD